MRRWACILVAAALSCGLGTSLPGAEAEVSDLDGLLQHVSVGGFVNNAQLYQPTEETRLERFAALRTSPDAAVAAAVVAMGPALERIQNAREIEREVERVNAELSRKYGPSFFEILACADDSIYNQSPARLQEYVRSGQLTQGEADQIYSDGQDFRSDVFGRFVGVMAATIANSAKASRQTFVLRNRAEAQIGEVGTSALPAALRARADPVLAEPLLDIGVGTARHRGKGGGEAFLTIVSRETRELTRLTIALKIDTMYGSRRALVYIPSLPAGGRFRSQAIRMEAVFLDDKPEAWAPLPAIERSASAIWCDQFHATGLTPAALTNDEMFWRLRLDAAAPGTVFVSTRAQFSTEKNGRYELRFTELEALPTGYRIALKLVDNDRKPPSIKTLRGTLQIPAEPPKVKLVDAKAEAKMDLQAAMKARAKAFQQWMSRPKSKGDIVARLGSGSDTFEIGLNYSPDGESSWSAYGGSMDGEEFTSASRLPPRDSAEAKARDRYYEASRLAIFEKYDEAEKALRKLMEDFPGTEWEEHARQGIEKLATLRAERAKREEDKKAAQARAAEQIPVNLLAQAQYLASQQQFDAAKKAYEQLRKEYRGTPWEEKADAGLKSLVTAKKDAEKRALEEKRKARLMKSRPKAK